MEQLRLTPRLQAVARLVPDGARLADVGTDHAHLPVWLLLQGRIQAAIATDIREGPLSRAKQTVAAHGLDGRVSLRLCPGLDAVAPEEADTVTICGMGGEMMIGILAAAPWTRGGTTLILQPQSNLPKLRCWLVGHGYQIERECLAREAHHWYPVLLVRGGACVALSVPEQLAGQPSAWEGDALRLDYLRFLEERCRKQQAAVNRSEKAADVSRREELSRCLAALEGWIHTLEDAKQ